MSFKHLYLVSLAAIIGCAHGGGTSRSGMPPLPRKSTFLAADEIAAANADIMTSYDALARLRPNWLSAHGVTTFNPTTSEFATVFVNGQHYGGLESLRNIPAYQVANVRYYDVTEAGAAYGLKGGTGGVIEVKMK